MLLREHMADFDKANWAAERRFCRRDKPELLELQ